MGNEWKRGLEKKGGRKGRRMIKEWNVGGSWLRKKLERNYYVYIIILHQILTYTVDVGNLWFFFEPAQFHLTVHFDFGQHCRQVLINDVVFMQPLLCQKNSPLCFVETCTHFLQLLTINTCKFISIRTLLILNTDLFLNLNQLPNRQWINLYQRIVEKTGLSNNKRGRLTHNS